MTSSESHRGVETGVLAAVYETSSPVRDHRRFPQQEANTKNRLKLKIETHFLGISRNRHKTQPQHKMQIISRNRWTVQEVHRQLFSSSWKCFSRGWRLNCLTLIDNYFQNMPSNVCSKYLSVRGENIFCYEKVLFRETEKFHLTRELCNVKQCLLPWMETKERGWGKKVVAGQRDISKAIKSCYNKHGAMIYERNQSVLNLPSVESIKIWKKS